MNVILTPSIYVQQSSSTEEAFQLQYGSVNPGFPYYDNTTESEQPLVFRLNLQQVTPTLPLMFIK
jgi:hypothetical protein